MSPEGEASTTLKDSSASNTASPTTLTVIVAVVAPAANATVPEAATKSLPATAVPALVDQPTLTGVVEAAESASWRVTVFVPLAPSATVASAIVTAGRFGVTGPASEASSVRSLKRSNEPAPLRATRPAAPSVTEAL